MGLSSPYPISDAGVSDNALISHPKIRDLTLPSTWIAETVPRAGFSQTGSFLVSGQLWLTLISLYAGAVVGHLQFLSGSVGLTRGSNADSHLWYCLCDINKVLLAITADDTSSAWAANSYHSLAIANIASGASATYSVPTTAAYYLGIMCVQGTGGSPALPAIVHSPLIASGEGAQSPRLSGPSTSSLTTPSGFPTTYGSVGAGTTVAKAQVLT